MSNTFADYSRYYDLFYGDKDYAAEAGYVMDLAHRQLGDIASVVDLGCGTGRHAEFLARRGLSVLGIDRSTEMVSAANARLGGIGLPAGSIRFDVGDVRDYRSTSRFDLATSLFHVMSYQVDDADVAAALECASRLLKPGGLFIFDFWNGPGVVECPPTTRVRRLQADGREVMRISEPTHLPGAHRVDVAFDVIALSDGKYERLREVHSMRYFFPGEWDDWLARAGFERVGMHAWMQERAPDGRDWHACIVARLQKGA